MKEHLIDTQKVHAWICEIFEAAGSSANEARLTADHLVLANLSGHDSHGVGMVPRYVKSLLNDELQLNRKIELAVDAGSMIIADGGVGMGQSVAHQAMTVAIERAGQYGIALMGLRNSHHLGRVGHWAEMAIAAGMVSIHFVNANTRTPAVTPYGGSQGRFLTNPFTVGIPRANGEHLVLDFATSAIAHGKARVAMNKQVPLPEGTTIDPDGRPTTDARVLFDEPMGAIRTFAQHKGHALAMVCEMLGGAMTGGQTLKPKDWPRQWSIINNMLTIVFDPRRLGTADSFETETRDFIEWVRSARLDEIGRELGGILMPGDPERRMRKARAQQLPIDDGTMIELIDAARAVAGARGKPVTDPTSLIVG